MEGSWHLYRPGSRWRRPAHEARVVLPPGRVDRGRVRPRGGRGCGPRRRGHRRRSPRSRPARPRLGRSRGRCGDCCRPSRPLADAMLDQRNLAGIGNLYKSELCFLAGATRSSRSVPSTTSTGSSTRPPHAGRQPRPRRADDHRRPPPRPPALGLPPRPAPCRRCGTRIRVEAGSRDAGAGDLLVPTCQPDPR